MIKNNNNKLNGQLSLQWNRSALKVLIDVSLHIYHHGYTNELYGTSENEEFVVRLSQDSCASVSNMMMALQKNHKIITQIESIERDLTKIKFFRNSSKPSILYK